MHVGIFNIDVKRTRRHVVCKHTPSHVLFDSLTCSPSLDLPSEKPISAAGRASPLGGESTKEEGEHSDDEDDDDAVSEMAIGSVIGLQLSLPVSKSISMMHIYMQV